LTTSVSQSIYLSLSPTTTTTIITSNIFISAYFSRIIPGLAWYLKGEPLKIDGTKFLLQARCPSCYQTGTDYRTIIHAYSVNEQSIIPNA